MSYTREREREEAFYERERETKKISSEELKKIEVKKSVKNVTRSAAKNTIDSLILPLKKEI